MLDGKVIGEDNELEMELFKTISFTNALVLKITQLAKQACYYITVTLEYLIIVPLRLLISKKCHFDF